MEMKVQKWLVHVMCAAFFMLLGGCGGQDTTVTMTTANASGIVTGRIVDSSTLQPVKNADVDLIANGVRLSTKSSASVRNFQSFFFMIRFPPGYMASTYRSQAEKVYSHEQKSLITPW